MKTNSSSLLVPAPPPRTATNQTVGSDIRDIKPPVAIPSGWSWLWWTLGAVAVATVAYLAARRWLKNRAAARVPEIIVPPDVRARNRLRQALELIDRPQPFCTLVSDTLRVYLEERFEFHAPDRTTEEFLDELQSSALLSLPQKQSLGEFLMQCDLVKFARYEPAEPELRSLYDAALRLVDETAPATITASAETNLEPPAPGAGNRERAAETK